MNATLWDRIGGRSLSIAIIVHAIVLILGAFWIFQIIREPEKKVDFMPPGGGGGERGAEHQIHQKQRKQIVPVSKAKRVVAQGARTPLAIPDQTDQFGEMTPLTSLDASGSTGGLGGSGSGRGFGRGSGTGNGMGTGHGKGTLFGLVPPSMSKRCDRGDRLKRITENGGTAACEDAVLKALRWLKANQNSDGSWSGQSKVAMTGLALLAYFGHCETPASDEFGDSCLKAIIYLVDIGMKNDGKLADNFTQQSWCYEHGIAAYALGEALTFCKEINQDVPYLAEVAEKAGQFIIDNQNVNGGWAYSYVITGGHTDMSIVGWQIQALKALSHTGIRFKGRSTCLNKAFKYIAFCQNAGGGYGYTGPDSKNGDYFTLTGVGMLCNQMWEKGNGPDVRKAAKYVRDNTKFDYQNKANLYAHYYESQAMMQSGGDDWKAYNALFRDQLLTNQAPDGSWKPNGCPHVNNDVFSTCLCTLMLEVYYRFLKTSGGERSSGIF
ncbi:MAG: terpene cyclase/mutase family protein [Verrucomicrobia bacterium]|nr:terpene cyclase/mutase family protein [Verrucomicrobiota bacterium]